LLAGLVLLAVNLPGYLRIEADVDASIDARVEGLKRQWLLPDPVAVEGWRHSALRVAKILRGGELALGGVLVVLGLAAGWFPVTAATAGFVLDLAVTAALVYLNPQWPPATDLLFQLIIAIALLRSVQVVLAWDQAAKATARPEGK
jgi:hypothetical protein